MASLLCVNQSFLRRNARNSLACVKKLLHSICSECCF
nr:MAG TPA: hypothetical protein [Caudoviricetes sp.]